MPALVAELGGARHQAAVVITAGFGEGGAQRGQALRQAMLDAARPHLLRIVGPNCLGVMVPGIGLNASFAHLAAAAGPARLRHPVGRDRDRACSTGRRRAASASRTSSRSATWPTSTSATCSTTSRSDPATRAILLYVEAMTHARKFMSAARAAAARSSR